VNLREIFMHESARNKKRFTQSFEKNLRNSPKDSERSRRVRIYLRKSARNFFCVICENFFCVICENRETLPNISNTPKTRMKQACFRCGEIPVGYTVAMTVG
jgi:hypothetical protein